MAIILIAMQLIWHLNIIAQEREIKLLPQTHTSKVDYSLFIMVAVLVMSERLEKRSRTATTAFPPPIFANSAFVSWFRVSLPLLREKWQENLGGS
jgi:hypothetical protein